MLDEGKITQREYDIVKGELISAAPEEWLDPEQPTDEFEPESEPTVEVDGEPSPAPDLGSMVRDWVERGKSLPTGYRWGAGAVMLVLFGFLFFGGGDPPSAGAELPATTPATQPLAAPVGSLGITIEDLDEAWNEAGIPPQITTGLAVTPESGPLDSLLYRFDSSALLAGAYDSSDGYLYAVMIKVGLFHDVLADMNTHLCHLLHPFSQPCIDAFRDGSGVEASTLAGFAGTDHEAEWLFEGNTWRLTMVDDVETVRVIAPGQP